MTGLAKKSALRVAGAKLTALPVCPGVHRTGNSGRWFVASRMRCKKFAAF